MLETCAGRLMGRDYYSLTERHSAVHLKLMNDMFSCMCIVSMGKERDGSKNAG
jgi:hypothetical protein